MKDLFHLAFNKLKYNVNKQVCYIHRIYHVDNSYTKTRKNYNVDVDKKM